MSNLLIRNGDSVEELSKLDAESIHLVVTSPPYDQLRQYKSHAWNFEDTARQIYRVLCEGGVCCWNVGDATVKGSESLTSFKQAIFFVEEAGFRLHDTMIYQKSNFSSPSFNRYHQVFEYIFILTKGEPRVFNPLMDRKNKTAGCVGNLGVNTYAEADGSRSVRKKNITNEYGMRHNVWFGKTRGQEDMCEKLDHPAMMPKWLARDLILSWSNSGDTILDPMFGSCTTGIQALENGRSFIGIECADEYVKIANNALKNITPGFSSIA